MNLSNLKLAIACGGLQIFANNNVVMAPEDIDAFATAIIAKDRAQRQAGQEPVATVAVDYTGGHERYTAEFCNVALFDGMKLYAAPQPAAQPDKDAEIAQLQDQNTSLDKALAAQDAEIAALRQDAERYRWLVYANWFDEAIMEDLGIVGGLSATVDSAVDASMAQAVQSDKVWPAYPEGDVIGPCVCGSWPGGKCLQCPKQP